MADQWEWFAQALEDRSHGRITCELYYVGALGYKGPEALSVVREGLVHVNEVVGAQSEGECPLVSVPNMPFVFKDQAEQNWWHRETFLPVFNEELEKTWNCKVIFNTPGWSPIMFFSKEPLTKPEDFAGKKVRTWGGINDDVLAAIGMTPFVIPTSDIYTSLQRGMIDTAITAYPSATECKFWEVLNYVDYAPLYTHRQWGVVNLDVFNELPEDLQEAVMLAGQDATHYWAYEIWFWPTRLLKMLTDGGMEVVYPEPGTMEAFKAMVKPVYQKWVDKVNFPAAEALMRDLGTID